MLVDIILRVMTYVKVQYLSASSKIIAIHTTQHTAFMRVFANVKVHITKGEFTKVIKGLISESVINYVG